MIEKAIKTTRFDSLLESSDIETIKFINSLEADLERKERIPRWAGYEVRKGKSCILIKFYQDTFDGKENVVAQYRLFPE